MGIALPRAGATLPQTIRLDPVEVAARWAHAPVIEIFGSPLPRQSLPALDGFLTQVRGMGQRQWDAFAAGGQVSRYSAATDAQNLERLASGERTTGLFLNTTGIDHAEAIASFVESHGLVATRYRTSLYGDVSHSVAASSDAATGEAIMRTHGAVDGVERDIALGMLLGYEPRDIAYYVNTSPGYAGVQYLLGT